MNELSQGYAADTPALSPGSNLVIAGKQIDGRTVAARRYRSLCADLAHDLGHAPNSGEWLLIQRAAALSTQAEMIEADMIGGSECDIETHIKITNTVMRLLGSLGLRTRDGKRAKVIDDGWAEAMGELSRH
ncbi:MAG TPA: hypothetical protein VK196_19650 [Magnetospirillum sp.]|nr:hypothetical protein [Magnetospirillum sp.]